MVAPCQHLSDRLLRWGWRGHGQRSALWFIISPRGTRGLPAAAQQWRGGDRVRHLWREETGNKRSVLTSPLSLRGDNHSEKLTGCPEAKESEAEERRRRRKESGESGIIAILSRWEKPHLSWNQDEEKKKGTLSLSLCPSLCFTDSPQKGCKQTPQQRENAQQASESGPETHLEHSPSLRPHTHETLPPSVSPLQFWPVAVERRLKLTNRSRKSSQASLKASDLLPGRGLRSELSDPLSFDLVLLALSTLSLQGMDMWLPLSAQTYCEP